MRIDTLLPQCVASVQCTIDCGCFGNFCHINNTYALSLDKSNYVLGCYCASWNYHLFLIWRSCGGRKLGNSECLPSCRLPLRGISCILKNSMSFIQRIFLQIISFTYSKLLYILEISALRGFSAELQMGGPTIWTKLPANGQWIFMRRLFSCRKWPCRTHQNETRQRVHIHICRNAKCLNLPDGLYIGQPCPSEC